MEEKSMYEQWLSSKDLTLTDKKGNKIIVNIIYHGDYMNNYGPDFQNCVLKINNRVLYGDVEFHTNSIDWFKHKHHIDSKYNKVILHIVHNDNSKIRITTRNNKRIKTYILKMPENIKDIKAYILYPMPCFYFGLRKDFNQKIKSILTLTGSKEFTRKTEEVTKLSIKYSHIKDITIRFDKITYIRILNGFGLYYNKALFCRIAESSKFSAAKIDQTIKLHNMRIRPYNHPIVRINQFNNLLKNSKGKIFTQLLLLFNRSSDFNDFTKHFTALTNKHIKTKPMGINTAKIIIFNYFLPILTVYKKFRKLNIIKLNDYIFNTKNFENNFITKRMEKNINKKIQRTEIMTLGLYNIYKNYCKVKNCTECKLYKMW